MGYNRFAVMTADRGRRAATIAPIRRSAVRRLRRKQHVGRNLGYGTKKSSSRRISGVLGRRPSDITARNPHYSYCMYVRFSMLPRERRRISEEGVSTP